MEQEQLTPKRQFNNLLIASIETILLAKTLSERAPEEASLSVFKEYYLDFVRRDSSRTNWIPYEFKGETYSDAMNRFVANVATHEFCYVFDALMEIYFQGVSGKNGTAEQHIERFSDALRKINWQGQFENDVKEINAFNVLEAYREFRNHHVHIRDLKKITNFFYFSHTDDHSQTFLKEKEIKKQRWILEFEEALGAMNLIDKVVKSLEKANHSFRPS